MDQQKKRHRSAINKSKARGWQKLVNEVNDDPWGLDYKLITRKIMPLQKPCMLSTAIIRGHPVRVDVNSAESIEGSPFSQ